MVISHVDSIAMSQSHAAISVPIVILEVHGMELKVVLMYNLIDVNMISITCVWITLLYELHVPSHSLTN